ncbi:hypothetical protein [Streptomyces sp. NPDC058280]|uniref:hypothetical protein n=1 Tax=Streptomyces sp. NPDC058280 TaxID=3346419 RepID=UPI0036EDA45D
MRRPRLYGVIGTLYRYDWFRGLEEVSRGVHDEDSLRYGDLRAPMFLASQMVRQLCETTVVDLDEELAAAA